MIINIHDVYGSMVQPTRHATGSHPPAPAIHGASVTYGANQRNICDWLIDWCWAKGGDAVRLGKVAIGLTSHWAGASLASMGDEHAALQQQKQHFTSGFGDIKWQRSPTCIPTECSLYLIAW